MLLLNSFDFIALAIVLVVFIPVWYCLKAYRFTSFKEYLVLTSVFMLGQLNMVAHGIVQHRDIMFFHKLEYFTMVFMYYVVYVMCLLIAGMRNSRWYQLIFAYATLHILYTLYLIIPYDYWLSPNSLLIHLNAEIYRIGSGIFMIVMFGTIESPLKYAEIKKVARLWQLVGTYIVLIGIHTIYTIFSLRQEYSLDLINSNVNIVGLLALAMISTSAVVVFRYPNAFIISHTQVLKALSLYRTIEEREKKPEPKMDAIIDYVEFLAEELQSVKDPELSIKLKNRNLTLSTPDRTPA